MKRQNRRKGPQQLFPTVYESEINRIGLRYTTGHHDGNSPRYLHQRPPHHAVARGNPILNSFKTFCPKRHVDEGERQNLLDFSTHCPPLRPAVFPAASHSRTFFWPTSQTLVLSDCRINFPSTVPFTQSGQWHLFSDMDSYLHFGEWRR